ncbi:hypothetical protein CONCODRAFT_15170 [Conidiobolus coronatus NRRL 28638]|uniref:AAA+ ATPase domain-containing protein n=1 Tax=Conidiobolus coronatus (strain ATCC 28846 / CBS 209.66 / NRRL 28638) TaxID=796925 RepID=A0A137PG80_CONC2|nr:hypothetical protein CONCODRAFT_15170 [Conidiobolus coronatus NRRL 28638]|eukprot:KXN73980.1 hypothetical protein CONCODRAFT_15170 [Conidiobolus coronatus NRRL 28638]
MSELYLTLKSSLNKPCSTLVGRTSEREQINSFFLENYESKLKTSTLYISGNPGTGKTALIQEFITKYTSPSDESLQSTKKRKLKSNSLGETIYYFNCTGLKTNREIYSKLFKLIAKDDEVNELSKIKDEKLKLENLILNNVNNGKKKTDKTIKLIILDEIDQLLGNKGSDENEELHQLIEWTYLPNSTLSLIGISNTLNLLEKFLPKLKAKGHDPLSINFLPYKVNELTDILKFKCKDLTYKDSEDNDQPLVNAKAIEFCSRKVASDTGDLRRALDLLVQVVDYTQEQFESSDSTEVIQVGIAQALSVTKLLNQNGLNNNLKGVNISQKLILISLLHNLKLNQVVKFDDIYDKYSDLCYESELFHPISTTEFRDCLTNLEVLGAIKITTKKVKKQTLELINLLSREVEIRNLAKGNAELEGLLPDAS